MTPGPCLSLRIESGVAVLLLNRPGVRNALDRALRAELSRTLLALAGDATIRAVVLGGAGPVFCAGADLGESGSGDVVAELLTEYRPCFDAIIGMDQPVLAAVEGSASGVGLSLALHCDLVVMAEDACLNPAFSRIDLVPDGGASYLLVQQVGYRRAFEFFLDAGRVGAARALELGLANRLAPAGQAIATAEAWARRLAQISPQAAAGTKRLLRLAVRAGFDEVYREESMLQAQCSAAEPFRRRLREFLARSSRPAAPGPATADGDKT